MSTATRAMTLLTLTCIVACNDASAPSPRLVPDYAIIPVTQWSGGVVRVRAQGLSLTSPPTRLLISIPVNASAGADEIVRRRKRLKYRSWHRGTKEMDLLLGPFADACLDGFDAPQLARSFSHTEPAQKYARPQASPCSPA